MLILCSKCAIWHESRPSFTKAPQRSTIRPRQRKRVWVVVCHFWDKTRKIRREAEARLARHHRPPRRIKTRGQPVTFQPRKTGELKTSSNRDTVAGHAKGEASTVPEAAWGGGEQLLIRRRTVHRIVNHALLLRIPHKSCRITRHLPEHPRTALFTVIACCRGERFQVAGLILHFQRLRRPLAWSQARETRA